MNPDSEGTSVHAQDLEAAVNVALTRFFASRQSADSTQEPSHASRKKKPRSVKVGSTGYYKQVKKDGLEKLGPDTSSELTVCLYYIFTAYFIPNVAAFSHQGFPPQMLL